MKLTNKTKNPRSWAEAMLAHQCKEVIAEAAKGRATAVPSPLLGGEVWICGRRHKFAARYYQRKLKKHQDMLNEFDLMEIVKQKFRVDMLHDPVKGKIQDSYKIHPISPYFWTDRVV